ncbi:MAG TPA: 5'-methylthioadenosine/S-adenosylhomocysteine nucleosidase [Ktedonobacteraceae bacterium]|nr:5'-methylthioadenosine/S-adenosylhomocysteine nucleosidase [Ktedonobacteraceae bacterium]
MPKDDLNLLRAVIFTAIPVEYQAVRMYLGNIHEEIHPEGTVYERGVFVFKNQRWNVSLVETRAGNVNAALEVERAIRFLQPGLILFVGVAGGIKDVKPGDVVAATKIYNYESGKAQEDFLARPEVGHSTYRMVERAQAEARKPDWLRWLGDPLPYLAPRVLIGAIAAGEKVVASTRSPVWQFLRTHYNDALAVEMEGFGFLRVAYANQQVNALVIRGISDLIDGKSEADAMNSQEIAARNASAFAFQMLAKLGEDDTFRTLLGENPDRVKGKDALNRGKAALMRITSDYIAAKQHFEEADRLLDEAQFPEESSQLKYLQAIVILNSHRPRGVTLSTLLLVTQLIGAANELYPSYSYVYALALVKRDFADIGGFPRFREESQVLKYRADLMSQTPQDKENMAILLHCQQGLLKASQGWWR